MPEEVLQELKRHLLYVAEKRGEDVQRIAAEVDLLVEDFELVAAKRYRSHMEEARDFIRDEKDAPFVAVSLYLRRHYRTVILLTYNKKDFKTTTLQKKGIHVLTPLEFISWLRENVA